MGLLLSGAAQERQEVGVEQPDLNRADLEIQGQLEALPRELPPTTPAGNKKDFKVERHLVVEKKQR